MDIPKQKCTECKAEVQAYNMANHVKNHELEKKLAAQAAGKK